MILRQRISIVVPFVILANFVVFVMWFMADINEISLQFMESHFLVSWQLLRDGHYWTLLGSAFSHQMVLHFLVNMYVLYGFGPIVEMTLGSYRFVNFYLIAAVVSSWSHAMVSAFFLHKPELPALGASGAVAGVVVLFSFMFPKQKILLFGIIPIPALMGALLFIGLDLWGLMAQVEGGGLPIGHGAHLGGALTGVLTYLWLRSSRL